MASPLAPLAFAQSPVGEVVRLRGEASATGEYGLRYLAPNAEIYLDDAIATGDGARLQIRFVDESTLTLGEDALIIVEDLDFASGQAADRQTLDIVKGVFRYVSGQIAAAARDQVAVRTPVATIGIRGTDFVGGELTVGMPPGRPHYGFQVREGAIDIGAPGGTVALDEPGEGTFLPLTLVAAPTPPRQWTPEEAAEADAALAF